MRLLHLTLPVSDVGTVAAWFHDVLQLRVVAVEQARLYLSARPKNVTASASTSRWVRERGTVPLHNGPILCSPSFVHVARKS